MVITRWQANAGVREANRRDTLFAQYHRERGNAGLIQLRYTAVPIGALIRKMFNGLFFHGRVVSGPDWRFDPELGVDIMCYRIVYNDGDWEDVRRDEFDRLSDVDVVREFLGMRP